MENPFAECRSLAEYNKRLIHLEDICTPREMAVIREQAHSLPDSVRERLGQTTGMIDLAKAGRSGFERIRLSTNAAYYRCGTAAAKILLVCFCGIANRLMLPLAAILQYVPDDRFDMLVLRDPTRSMYLRGIPELAGDFTSALQHVSEFASRCGYREIRCYGTSAGGAPALYAAMFLGATMGISIGGHHPTCHADQVNFPAGCSGDELDQALTGGKAHVADPQLLLAFGASFPGDRQGAASLQQRMPRAKGMAVPGCDMHNLNLWLVRHAMLKPFLDQTLLIQG